jgi:hypothetical protein
MALLSLNDRLRKPQAGAAHRRQNLKLSGGESQNLCTAPLEDILIFFSLRRLAALTRSPDTSVGSITTGQKRLDP